MKDRELQVVQMAMVGRKARIEFSDPNYEKHTMIVTIEEVYYSSDNLLLVKVKDVYSDYTDSFYIGSIKEFMDEVK